jgi:hypothetical protein
MGEIVAWGLGLGLGWTARNALTSRWRVVLFAAAIVGLGCVITLLSGEFWAEPWLVAVDIGQVMIAALLGMFGLPVALRWLLRLVQTA